MLGWMFGAVEAAFAGIERSLVFAAFLPTIVLVRATAEFRPFAPVSSRETCTRPEGFVRFLRYLAKRHRPLPATHGMIFMGGREGLRA